MIWAKSTEKFGHAHYLYIDTVLQKAFAASSANFRPIFMEFGQNSAAEFSGRLDFYAATFCVLCPNFCPVGNTYSKLVGRIPVVRIESLRNKSYKLVGKYEFRGHSSGQQERNRAIRAAVSWEKSLSTLNSYLCYDICNAKDNQ
jgi:hypothetical protein